MWDQATCKGLRIHEENGPFIFSFKAYGLLHHPNYSRLLLKHTYGVIGNTAESGLNSGLTMPAHEMSQWPGVIIAEGREKLCLQTQSAKGSLTTSVGRWQEESQEKWTWPSISAVRLGQDGCGSTRKASLATPGPLAAVRSLAFQKLPTLERKAPVPRIKPPHGPCRSQSSSQPREHPGTQCPCLTGSLFSLCLLFRHSQLLQNGLGERKQA